MDPGHVSGASRQPSGPPERTPEIRVELSVSQPSPSVQVQRESGHASKESRYEHCPLHQQSTHSNLCGVSTLGALFFEKQQGWPDPLNRASECACISNLTHEKKISMHVTLRACRFLFPGPPSLHKASPRVCAKRWARQLSARLSKL